MTDIPTLQQPLQLPSDKQHGIGAAVKHALMFAPFQVLALIDSPLLHKLVAEIWVREECPQDDVLGPIPRRPIGDKAARPLKL